MPQTKTKPAAQPIKPTLPELTTEQHQENFRLRHLGELIHDISELPLFKLKELQTYKLIMDRERGCTTPVEAFIEGLVVHYQGRDEKGQGLTMDDIKFQMNQLGEQDLREALETAYFMTDRYPRPEPEAERA